MGFWLHISSVVTTEFWRKLWLSWWFCVRVSKATCWSCDVGELRACIFFSKGMKRRIPHVPCNKDCEMAFRMNCTTVDLVRTRVVLLYLLRLFDSSIVSLSNSWTFSRVISVSYLYLKFFGMASCSINPSMNFFPWKCFVIQRDCRGFYFCTFLLTN